LFHLALVLLLPAWASAQLDLKPYNRTASIMFTISDANRDGILTLTEIDSNFQTYDRDNDGKISRYEYTSHVDQNSPSLHAFSHGLYDIYDVDNDDVLELHDFESFFKLMDANGDGAVVEPEYVRYWIILLEALEHLHGGGRKRKMF